MIGNMDIKNHGHKGGKTTAKRYGANYMRMIALKGLKNRWEKVKKNKAKVAS